MKLPYYYKLSIKSLYSADEIRGILTKHTLTDTGISPKDSALKARAKNWADDSKSRDLYRTTLTATGFELFTVPARWNYESVTTRVCVATFHGYGTGCRLVLTFKMVAFIRIFMYIWGFGVLFGSSSIFFGSLSEGKYRDALITPFAFIPFYLGFWFFHKVGFKDDVDKCLLFLRTIGIATK
ncbi:MAG: hypothetical protein EOO61_22430 [Hymenobacter sp.]|nr:MAG: hypothetical protein EOO61_22430 [Hymenobacter sp.]